MLNSILLILIVFCMNVNGARMLQFRIWYSHESCRARLNLKSLQDSMVIWPNLFAFRSKILHHVMLSHFMVIKRNNLDSPGYLEIKIQHQASTDEPSATKRFRNVAKFWSLSAISTILNLKNCQKTVFCNKAFLQFEYIF